MDINKMVVGFLFSHSDIGYNSHVALIMKQRPQWQRGFLNGPGGHVEDGENSKDAMIREFEEETGIHEEHWKKFATLNCVGGTAEVDFFKGFILGRPYLTSRTDECVNWYPVHLINELPIIQNLKWMIPLAIHYEDNCEINIKYT